jgi:hypothetical protein
MNNRHNPNVRKLITSLTIVIGLLLIAGAVGIAVAQADFSHRQTAADVVDAMEKIIPSRKRAFPESHSGSHMPRAEIGGEDFIGLLEIEDFQAVLPVSSDWENVEKGRFPAEYSGSVYDRDLIIGAGNGEGQFSFIDVIEIGAKVRFTDLYGQVFYYDVQMINHVEKLEDISSGEDDLTLFAPSRSTSKYVVIRCRLSGM